VLCDRIAIMDGGQVIACDTPAGLIRSLALEATVSATIASGTIDERTLTAMPGVVSATVATHEAVPRLRLQTDNAQATITALLAHATTHDLVLDDLNSTRATLEDVFLAKTGRTYTQDEGEEAPVEAAPTKRRGRRRAA
jgi:ABC-2 type transport system ATP-binding protein